MKKINRKIFNFALKIIIYAGIIFVLKLRSLLFPDLSVKTLHKIVDFSLTFNFVLLVTTIQAVITITRIRKNRKNRKKIRKSKTEQ